MTDVRHYEFDDAQNQTLQTLAQTLRFLGGLTLILAVIGLIGLAVAAWQRDWSEVFAGVIITLFCLTLGSFMIRSGSAFDRVVQTSGSDIDHLMLALDQLAKKYSYLSAIVIFCLVVNLIGIGLAIAASLTDAP